MISAKEMRNIINNVKWLSAEEVLKMDISRLAALIDVPAEIISNLDNRKLLFVLYGMRYANDQWYYPMFKGLPALGKRLNLTEFVNLALESLEDEYWFHETKTELRPLVFNA